MVLIVMFINMCLVNPLKMLSQIHQMPPLTVLVDHYVRQDHVAASFENSVTTRQVRLLQVLPPPAPLSNVESGVESRRATSPIPVFFKEG